MCTYLRQSLEFPVDLPESRVERQREEERQQVAHKSREARLCHGVGGHADGRHVTRAERAGGRAELGRDGHEVVRPEDGQGGHGAHGDGAGEGKPYQEIGSHLLEQIMKKAVGFLCAICQSTYFKLSVQCKCSENVVKAVTVSNSNEDVTCRLTIFI